MKFIDFQAKEVIMKILCSRCAGLDVHKKSVCACIRISQGEQAKQTGMSQRLCPEMSPPN